MYDCHRPPKLPGSPAIRNRTRRYHVTTMATQIGIRELRDNLTTTIRRVSAGETIEITNHGKPVAVLSPAPRGRIAQLIARGEATPPKHPLRVRDLRPLPVTGEMTASEALQEDRGD